MSMIREYNMNLMSACKSSRPYCLPPKGMFCFSFTKHHEGVSNEKQLYLQANKLKYTITNIL